MQILNIVTPVQASVNDSTLVAGSILNAGRAQSISYTISNTGAQSIDWEVRAGNQADLSDSIVAQAFEAVAADAEKGYGVANPPYMFYGIYIKSTSSGQHGEATIAGASKG